MSNLWYLIISLIRSFYIVTAAGILIARLTPALHDRFLAYGARQDHKRVDEDRNALNQRKRSSITEILDYTTTFTVPHSWFTHFYVVSTCSALFWTTVLSTDLIRDSSTVWSHYKDNITHTPNYWHYKARGCVLFMLLHSVRRLYECVYIAKPSRSRMWIGHYLVGIAFYLVTNVAIWVDTVQLQSTNGAYHSNPSSPTHILLELIRLSLCLYQLTLSSYTQNTAHRYLSTLTSYQIPSHPLFATLIAPHYTSEIAIYATLVVLATPRPDLTALNWTMACSLVFVTVNLGITAEGTKRWLLKKFPDQRSKIEKRYILFPHVW